MKKFIIIFILVFWSLFLNDLNYVSAWNLNISIENIDSWTSRNYYLTSFWNWISEFFWISTKWWKGLFYTMVQIAYSLKNLMFYFATIFYLIIAIKLLVAENTEEQSTKFKKWIIWITAWLIIMQMAYAYTLTLYAKSVWESLAFSLIDNIINPLIWLVEVLASFVFIAIAIFAFYRMITANWKEEEVSRAKMSIVYAIMWVILLKLAKLIVEWVYGKLECKAESVAWLDIITTTCLWNAQYSTLTNYILQVINWVNSFIWIITIILIIYAWFNIIFSHWEEEKIKKAKSTLIYIAIWIFLLVVNYLILTFFITSQI